MTPPDRSAEEQTSTPSSRRTWAMIAAVIVLTLVAVWMIPERPPAPPAEPPEAPAPKSLAGEIEPLPATPAPAPAAEAPATPGPEVEGGRARAFLAAQRAAAKTPDPALVLAEARRQQRQGHAADAYLLYFYAARHGDPQAALALAGQADPASWSAETSLLDAPDPEQANKWYALAASAGSGEAAERLARLRQRVEAAAAAGDEQARRLTLQWQ